MGLDLYWHSVDWEELSKRYSSASDFDEISSAINDSDCQWLITFDLEDEWLSLLQSWYGLLEFNDELIEWDRQLHDCLSREFPCLVDCGLIWDAERLYPVFPNEVAEDDAGHIIGTFSPVATQKLLDGFVALDRARLTALLDASEDFSDSEIFSDSAEFLRFIDAITEAIRRTTLAKRGILVLMSY